MVEELIKELVFLVTAFGVGVLATNVIGYYSENFFLKYSCTFDVETGIEAAQKGQHVLREHNWLRRAGYVYGLGQQLAQRKFLVKYNI